MTTTNDVHPMVMKAARAMAEAEEKNLGVDLWEKYQQEYIRLAQSALTECGALECLEALEMHNRATGYTETDAADVATIRAIAKVYGSAP